MASKRKVITLKGPAARAFIELSAGIPAKSIDEELVRLATLVYLDVKDDRMDKAVELLRSVFTKEQAGEIRDDKTL